MRYGDGGGLNSAARERRELVRRRAGELFAEGVTALGVAAVLEVSANSAYRWRRAWAAGGVEALASKGPPGPDPVLSEAQLVRLRQQLELGPAAAGYGEDQRWTLQRIAALIATMFHQRVSIATAWQVMRRLGYTAQLPVHRAVERDEQAITHWRRRRWPALKGSRAG
ncbi:winged helix-turn-helix domain-containing protein [Dactylosporangium sp. NPDC006015]|uniref:winged helix-turn-helix domain-containing protein n=1 Tax=Dactylosporangium sp. NPDC006015 TaxID=3154576 RepID=UPI0033B433E3